jgi:hypothetical protein
MKSWGSESTLKRVTFANDDHGREIVSAPPHDDSEATAHDSALDAASARERARFLSMKSWGSGAILKRVTFAYDDHVREIPRVGRGRSLSLA